MQSETNRPTTVMIAAFDGWNDACQAATDVVRHLVRRYEASEIRHISCDGYYDYQVSRPMACHMDGRRRIIWPQTTFYEMKVSPTLTLIAQIAPEPNYRWMAYCRQSLAIAEECDVDRIVTLGSMFAECPHTRQLPVSVSEDGSHSDLQECYDGPVGIPTVLDEMARESGFETTSMWVSIPQYLGADECAPGTLRLLETLSGLLGIELDLGDLEQRAESWRAQASVLTRCNDDLADYVHRLEAGVDGAKTPTPPVPLDGDAEALVREAEAYLKGL